jgi:hypothetical protein
MKVFFFLHVLLLLGVCGIADTLYLRNNFVDWALRQISLDSICLRQTDHIQDVCAELRCVVTDFRLQEIYISCDRKENSVPLLFESLWLQEN